jgi:hypothetical protein
MINYKQLNDIDAKRFFCFIERIEEIKGNYPENSEFFIDHSNDEVVGYLRKSDGQLEEIFRYPDFLIDNTSNEIAESIESIHCDNDDKIELSYNDSPELLEVTDLKFSPMLKELLIMYVSRQYEENARYEDYYLMAEYELLKRDNKLDLLFIEERLTNILNSDNQDE